MSIAQVKHVKHARKDQGECAVCKTPLPAGSEYRYYKPGFRSRTKIRLCMKSECTPRNSQLESSRLSEAWSAIEDAEDVVESTDNVEAMQEALDGCASAIRDLASEYEDSVQTAPMLEDQLGEKIDALGEFADELEGTQLDDEPEKPDPPREPNRQDFETDAKFQETHDYYRGVLLPEYEGELKEWREECKQVLESARDDAKDALSAANFG